MKRRRMKGRQTMKKKIGYILMFAGILLGFGFVGGIESDQFDLLHGSVYVLSSLAAAYIGGILADAFN